MKARKRRNARAGRGRRRARDVEDLRVGDVVLLRWDDEIPADVVMIRTSDERGLACVETANLGGRPTSSQDRRARRAATAGRRERREN